MALSFQRGRGPAPILDEQRVDAHAHEGPQRGLVPLGAQRCGVFRSPHAVAGDQAAKPLVAEQREDPPRARGPEFLVLFLLGFALAEGPVGEAVEVGGLGVGDGQDDEGGEDGEGPEEGDGVGEVGEVGLHEGQHVGVGGGGDGEDG